VCITNPESKGKYIKIILALLQSSSTAVVYECAGTLVALSQAPTAIRAAANCWCQLLVSQSDNNVKLIVLVGAVCGRAGGARPVGAAAGPAPGRSAAHPTRSPRLAPAQPFRPPPPDPRPFFAPQDRLSELKEKHRDVMRDVLLDVLRALAAPNSDIRRKTLDLALDLIDSR
jgi:hypothetical protein